MFLNDAPTVIPPSAASQIGRARELVRRVEETYLDLGDVLLQITESKAHRTLGYRDDLQGYQEFLACELGLKYRKARYLIGIAEMVRDCGLDREEVGSIGWSKVKEIAGASKESVQGLIELAKTSTLSEVSKAAKLAKGRTARTKVTVSARLWEDEAEIVSDAISAAIECGAEDESQALMMIAVEWMTHAAQRASDIPLEAFLAVIERRYGVKLDVVV